MSLIVDEFKSLALPARMLTLHRIIESLTVHELRILVAANGRYKFQRDIVADLPIELICLIFAHLDHTAPFRLQLVSRKWRHLLTTQEVMAASMSSWVGRGVPSLRSSLDAGLDPLYLHARRIRAFSTFNPFSTSIQYSKYNLMPRRFAEAQANHMRQRNTRAFHQDTVAWTAPDTPGSRLIEVINLVTGTHSVFQGHARESFASIALTRQLAAGIVSSGLCYVFDLESSNTHTFRLPSGLWGPFTGYAGRLAVHVAHGPSHLEGTGGGSIFLWNRDTLSTNSFPLPEPGHLIQEAISSDPNALAHYLYPRDPSLIQQASYCSIILSSYTESVVVFAIHNRCHGRCCVLFTRYTYSGQVINSGICIFNAAMRDMRHYITPRPMDDEGRFVVAYADFEGSNDHQLVVFDDTKSQLTDRIYSGPNGMEVLFRGHDRPGPWLQWKSIAYWSPLVRDIHVIAYDSSTDLAEAKHHIPRSLSNLEFSEDNEQTVNRHNDSDQNGQQPPTTTTTTTTTRKWDQGTILEIFGNERFVIVFRNRCIEVCSFEFGVSLPELDVAAFPGYRRRRIKDLGLATDFSSTDN